MSVPIESMDQSCEEFPDKGNNTTCGNESCTKEGTMRCSQCKDTLYCSQACQKEDW